MRILLLCFSLIVLVGAEPGRATSRFYHCRDAEGVNHYQSLPCPHQQQAVAERIVEIEHRSDEPVARVPRRPAGHPAAGKQPPRIQRGQRGQRGSATPEKFVAFGCTAGGEQWVQPAPCRESGMAPQLRDERRSGASGRGAVRQRALTRAQVCAQVRDGSLRGAPSERAADSTYRRNLLRDRVGC